MRGLYPHTGLKGLCGLFGRTRQAFYDYEHQRHHQLIKDGFILDQVRDIRLEMPKIGAKKLHFLISPLLREHHQHIGRDRFSTLLRDHNMLVKRPKRYYIKTTDSDHPYFKWTNLIEGLVPDRPHQLWVSDITYLRTESGFVYLSLLTDAFSRKIVGHHLSHSLSAQGCIRALEKAIAQLPEEGHQVIHHSDRGVQYCCAPYVAILQAHKISISMTQNGSPYENAQAERINGILKTEFGLGETFGGYRDALRATSGAIDIYNRKRPHLSCKMQTPQAAHSVESHSGQPINPKQLSKREGRIFTTRTV